MMVDQKAVGMVVLLGMVETPEGKMEAAMVVMRVGCLEAVQEVANQGVVVSADCMAAKVVGTTVASLVEVVKEGRSEEATMEAVAMVVVMAVEAMAGVTAVGVMVAVTAVGVTAEARVVEAMVVEMVEGVRVVGVEAAREATVVLEERELMVAKGAAKAAGYCIYRAH